MQTNLRTALSTNEHTHTDTHTYWFFQTYILQTTVDDFT